MAQNPSTCQLCEVETNIEWKCYECDILFCDGCRVKIHSKLKISDSHHVLNIKTCKEENSEIFQRAQLKNKPCDKHVKQKCIFYCDECNELICAACLPESHSSHKFQEMEEAFDKKLTAIKKIQDESKKELEEINKESLKLDEFLLCSRKNCETDKLKILNQKTILKMRIEEKAIEFLDDLDERKNKLEERILKQRKAVLERKNDLSQKTKKIKSALECFQSTAIFETFKEVKKDEIPYNYLDFEKVFRFKSKGSGIVASGFGSFEEDASRGEWQYVEINLDDFHMALPLHGSIAGIVNCKSESQSESKSESKTFWIYNNENVLRKVRLNNVFLHVEIEIFVKVQDISVDKDGVLFLIEKGSSDIKRLTKKKGLRQFANMSPFQPICIHAKENHEIIVGLINEGKCQVVILGQSGKVKSRFLFDKNNDQLIHYPHRLTSVSNGDIWVVDYKPDLEGRVVILNKDGKFKLIITKDDVQDKFEPHGLVSTDSGHVIVLSKGRFFIFSQNGSCLDLNFISIYQQQNNFDEYMRSTLKSVLLPLAYTRLQKAKEIYLLEPYIGVEKEILMFCFMHFDENGEEKTFMKTAKMDFIY